MPTILTLQGLTRKGKNRINELGSKWILVEKLRTVFFSNDPNWLGIQSLTHPKAFRWIRATGDEDFLILSRTNSK